MGDKLIGQITTALKTAASENQNVPNLQVVYFLSTALLWAEYGHTLGSFVPGMTAGQNQFAEQKRAVNQ